MPEPILGKNGRALARAFAAMANARTPFAQEAPVRRDLLKNIEEIAVYTQRHPELQKAHHFLYDLRSPRDGAPEYVVMGVNPGETARDWSVEIPTPTEETSRFDFHEQCGPGRSSIRWTRAASYFLDGADHVLTELFFWSSRDHVEFERRYGKFRTSPHLPFCVRMNRDLVAAYAPRAVVLPGLSHHAHCAPLYGLSHVRTARCGEARVAEIYTDGRRPWVFTKHWTAAFGFSKAQKEAVRGLIRHPW